MLVYCRRSYPTDMLALLMCSSFFLLVCASGRIYYVTPDRPSINCLNHPCFTLDQYIQQEIKFITAGSTFMFLPGNHTSTGTLHFSHVSDIAFKKWPVEQEVTIWCRNGTFLQGEYVENLTIDGLHFWSESSHDINSINLLHSSHILINHTSFRSVNYFARALYVTNSSITITGSSFEDYSAPGNGGAIFASAGSSLYLFLNYFYKNRAYGGGAIYLEGSEAIWHSDAYLSNAAKVADGGAVLAKDSLLTFNGGSFFNNTAEEHGGAISLDIESSLLINCELQEWEGADTTACVIFTENTATFAGGAIACFGCTIDLISSWIIFDRNTAYNDGGAMYFDEGSVNAINSSIRFTYNFAKTGGAIALAYNSDAQISGSTVMKFSVNDAGTGGGLSIDDSVFMAGIATVIVFQSNTAFWNGGGVALGVYSDLHLSGTTKILDNEAKNEGGGIKISRKSEVSFGRLTLFINNKASLGGAMYLSYQIALDLYSVAAFAGNSASEDGGAIYAQGTYITIGQGNITFDNNSANNGGGLFLGSTSTLVLGGAPILTMSNNHAKMYGGAIYYVDSANQNICKFNMLHHDTKQLPYCFLKFNLLRLPPSIYASNETKRARNNTAGRGGNYLYGGFFDRCKIDVRADSLLLAKVMKKRYKEFTKEMSSRPYKLCFCGGKGRTGCSSEMQKSIYRGQEFNLSVAAMDQFENLVPTQVTAVTHTARLKLNESSQFLNQSCSTLHYTLFSRLEIGKLVLYPDGPCRDTGFATAVVNVTFLPCPNGFRQVGELCTCEKALQKYGAECFIDRKEIYILRKKGSKFWVNATYSSNHSYQGLIHFQTCPFGYCKESEMRLNLDDPNMQCANHHSGILCGACAPSYSLLLGSSRCAQCSNVYLTLLIPFAAAGALLVFLLTFLKMTVASGMINSIILYANIVQANKDAFFILGKNNILTVFIAWMNLDLGIETCFYNGMSAYSQTWLQFVFPFYVWSIIAFIIVGCRYSMFLSKCVGTNPVAVLATLLLMSYSKILKIVIEVYASVNLNFPDNKTVTVWLKDANMPYLHSTKHVSLTVIISLILMCLFLPYTVCLLLGYKAYRFSNQRYLHFVSTVKPLLDAYYAPYKKTARFWPGLLLLIRCAFFLIFSFGSRQGRKISLPAIAITFSILSAATAYLSPNIKSSRNIIEILTYLNLVALSVFTAQLNSQGVVYALVGIVFVTMLGVVAYHFHILYTSKLKFWKRLLSRTDKKNRTSTLKDIPHNLAQEPTKTVVELREPLLD